jgi:hypothetical protein
MDRLYVYKVIHIYGIALLFAAVGGLTLTVANGATKQTSGVRKLIAATHGTAAFLILLGGFGMLAREGIIQNHVFPGWLWGKIVVWLILSVIVIVPYKRPDLARPLFIATPLLAALAAYLAIFKPF